MRTTATRRPDFRRLIGSLAVAAITATLVAGCDKDAPEAAADPSTPLASSPAAATPSATHSAAPSAKPTRKPTTPAEGDGDSEGDGEPAAAGGGICASLSEAEVGAVLGGEITGSAIPGNQGCSFNQTSPNAPAATVYDVAFADMTGGMDGAKDNATSAVEGDPVDLAGIGDAAFVVTGTSFGGTDLQGAGAVRVGGRLINIQLAQSEGLSRAKVRALVVNLLKLAVAKS